MENSADHKKVLENILATQEFDKLEPFSDACQWAQLNKSEKELLSLLFVMQGEKELSEGRSEALDSFQKANAIYPDNPGLLCRQAMAFLGQSSNQSCLMAACKIYETALSVKADHFEAWHGWGNSLSLLGVLNQEPDFFKQAFDKYSHAENCLDQQDLKNRAMLHHDRGVCWFASGKASGEPQDFINSIDSFKQSASAGCNTPNFWSDFGSAICELAQLMNQPELLTEAVDMLWKCVKLNPAFTAGWHQLGILSKLLYQTFSQDSYFQLSHECFEKVIDLDPYNGNIWANWAELLICKGKYKKDLDAIKEGCEKFETAELYESNNPYILSSWAEGLLIIGSWTENLSFLKEALIKIEKSLKVQRDLPKTWCLYGSCLSEIGKYFKHSQYYLDAAEKFQIGLKLNPKDPLLLHGIARVYFTLGILLEDSVCLDEAAHYCRKVISVGGQHLPQFWNDWGLVLMKLGNIKDEKRYFKSAVGKFENAVHLSWKESPEEPQDIEYLYNLACSYECLGDFEETPAIYEKAVYIFKKIVEIDPAFIPVYFNLGCVLSRLGEFQRDLDLILESNKYFDKFLEYEPEDDHAWNEWGVALLAAGELAKDPVKQESAQAYFSEAEKKFMQSAALGNYPAIYHLACLYSLNENPEASIYFLEKCRENNALPHVDDLLSDSWLENVRKSPLFLDFLSQLS